MGLVEMLIIFPKTLHCRAEVSRLLQGALGRAGLGSGHLGFVRPQHQPCITSWPWFHSPATSQHIPGMCKNGTTLELPRVLSILIFFYSLVFPCSDQWVSVPTHSVCSVTHPWVALVPSYTSGLFQLAASGTQVLFFLSVPASPL